MGEPGRNAQCPQHCDACFSGEYPIALTDHEGGAHAAQLSFLTEVAGSKR
jgi:amidophosphoribosyltransferase